MQQVYITLAEIMIYNTYSAVFQFVNFIADVNGRIVVCHNNADIVFRKNFDSRLK